MGSAVAFGQLMLATVFILSALPKLRHFSDFADHLTGTLPRLGKIARPVAVTVVAAELITALALLTGGRAWIGFSLSLALLVPFTVYLLTLVTTRSGAPCGCAGGSDQPASWVHVLRNIALITLAGTLWLLAGHHEGESIPAYTAVLAPSLVAAAFFVYLDEIFTFFARTEGGRVQS